MGAPVVLGRLWICSGFFARISNVGVGVLFLTLLTGSRVMFERTTSALLLRCIRNVPTPVRRGYKAAVVTEIGKPVEVREFQSKKPDSTELILEVESCGFNYADWKMMKGMYHLKPKVPFVPGFELAGNVKAVGEGVKKWKEGDRVMVLRSRGTGGFSEECVVKDHDMIYSLPYNIDYETAAAVGVCYGTAYLSLATMAKERQGSSVLVLSSRGTMGFAAIDLAQNVFKAEVFAASDNEDKLEKLRETGVQRTINWEKEDMPKIIRKATFGHGVDIVIDTVGGKVFHQALESLKSGGHLMSLSFASGEIPSVSLLDLHRLQASVTGVWLGGRSKSEMDATMSTIIGLFDEGYLNARIESKYSLDQVNQLIKDVEDNKIFGKVVVNPKGVF